MYFVLYQQITLDKTFVRGLKYILYLQLEPELCLEHFFVVEKLQMAMEFDQALKYSVHASVLMANKIDGTFDKISRNKGASILRMLNDLVGEKAFKKALNLYLTKNR